MGKIKMKIFVVALVAALMALFSTTTLAYYQTVGKATSVITSGNLRLLIHEKTAAGTPLPEEGVYVVPGDIVSKEINVENACEHPFYLRVKIVYGVDSKDLSAEECFRLNINPDDWEYHNGWYYYKSIVAPRETTKNVFSQVEIVGAKVDQSYIGKTLTLSVDAQAVQSENNPVSDGKIYTAFGWPSEEGGIK